MHLAGYTPVAVAPWETASGGKAVVCRQATCSASAVFTRPDGWFDIAVQYFDLNDGVSHFTLEINGSPVDAWAADDTLPSDKLNGHTSTRHTTAGVALHRGDRIRIVGAPGGSEPAPLDYLEITPAFSGSMREAVKK